MNTSRGGVFNTDQLYKSETDIVDLTVTFWWLHTIIIYFNRLDFPILQWRHWRTRKLNYLTVTVTAVCPWGIRGFIRMCYTNSYLTVWAATLQILRLWVSKGVKGSQVWRNVTKTPPVTARFVGIESAARAILCDSLRYCNECTLLQIC